MSNRTLSLTDAIYDYLLAVSLREPTILRELRQITAELTSREMQIAPEQGQFLALLVELIGARKTLEVGVYTGYSSLAVALALPSDGYIVACDINEEWTQIARRFWEKAQVSHKIRLHLAPAMQTLDKLITEGHSASFDFAFIDADKRSYDRYYEKCLDLVRPGGLIAIDNTLWGGGLADPNNHEKDTVALRELNQKIHQDPRVHISLVPIGDGLTLIRKL